MTERDFMFWLQGYMEEIKTLNEQEVQTIKNKIKETLQNKYNGIVIGSPSTLPSTTIYPTITCKTSDK